MYIDTVSSKGRTSGCDNWKTPANSRVTFVSLRETMFGSIGVCLGAFLKSFTQNSKTVDYQDT